MILLLLLALALSIFSNLITGMGYEDQKRQTQFWKEEADFWKQMLIRKTKRKENGVRNGEKLIDT